MTSVNYSETKNDLQKKLDIFCDQIKKIINNPDFLDKFSKSVDACSNIYHTISTTTTNHWAEDITDSNGNPLFETDEEKRQFELLLQPYVKEIRQKKEEEKQTGGDTDVKISSDIPTSIGSVKMGDILKSKLAEVDPDELFNSFVQATQKMDKSVKHFSSNYGLLKLQNDFDKDYKNDVHLIPQPIRRLPALLPYREITDQIKLPLRFIIFIIFLYLDVSRTVAAMSGLVTTQKILSSVLALLEFLRGDWKKSLLTFIGIFGTSPLLVGQFIKIFLYLFEKLSPTLQERIVYGSWDALKSFIAGVLLSILQVTAPFEVRTKISNVLAVLREGKQGIDKKLEEAGYKPRQDFFSPTWDDLNNLQAVNDDPVFICSKEFEDLISSKKDIPPLLRIVLELLRIPINENIRDKFTCSQFPKPRIPYLELLKLDRQQKSPSTPISTPTTTLEETITPTPGETIIPTPGETITPLSTIGSTVSQVTNPILEAQQTATRAAQQSVDNLEQAAASTITKSPVGQAASTISQTANTIGRIGQRLGGKRIYNTTGINKV
jgi:hypothetical protein